MKHHILIFSFLVLVSTSLLSQQIDYSKLTGKYLGQKEPGLKAELFASGLVSTGEGVHGNIVFTSDFSEAAWHPNYNVDGKALLYIMKYRNGKWEAPTEFFPKEGFNFILMTGKYSTIFQVKMGHQEMRKMKKYGM